MRLFVRYLLWLLIAALPLQGVMAAAMACQEGARQAAMSSHQAADQTAQAESHCGGEESQPTSSHGKCSQCASCCIGAAAPPAVTMPVTLAHSSSTAVAWLEPAMTAYFPSGLERPPRQSR